jgi:pantothenate kinase type III
MQKVCNSIWISSSSAALNKMCVSFLQIHLEVANLGKFWKINVGQLMNKDTHFKVPPTIGLDECSDLGYSLPGIRWLQISE